MTNERDGQTEHESSNTVDAQLKFAALVTSAIVGEINKPWLADRPHIGSSLQVQAASRSVRELPVGARESGMIEDGYSAPHQHAADVLATVSNARVLELHRRLDEEGWRGQQANGNETPTDAPCDPQRGWPEELPVSHARF